MFDNKHGWNRPLEFIYFAFAAENSRLNFFFFFFLEMSL